jgi:hypothetical protein
MVHLRERGVHSLYYLLTQSLCQLLNDDTQARNADLMNIMISGRPKSKIYHYLEDPGF